MNRLNHPASPHLLQHRNPVDWCNGATSPSRTRAPAITPCGSPSAMPPAIRAMPWRMRAVENRAVAVVMNELFVNIKVDRKERRDIDSVCMSTRHDFDLAKRQSTHIDR